MFCTLIHMLDCRRKNNYMPKANFIPQKSKIWIDVRKRFKLSHVHIQMARELGMNPKRFGKLVNHGQESWKLSLPLFIEEKYFKHFKKRQPDTVKSIEQIVKDKRKAKEALKAKRMQTERKEE